MQLDEGNKSYEKTESKDVFVFQHFVIAGVFSALVPTEDVNLQQHMMYI